MRNIVIHGSTGSIGRSALDVIDRHPDKLKLVGVSANIDHKELSKQIKKYNPLYAMMSDSAGLMALKAGLGESSQTKILEDTGFTSAMADLSAVPEADIILNAIVGIAGLRATTSALTAGKTVALANKESMVVAGPILRKLAQDHKGLIIPVDSEHSAIMQCLQANTEKEISRLILTGSGGPFLNTDDLDSVTAAQAMNHPTWKMGPKITIDSATMMNKALEIIEAAYLFGLPGEKIDVVIHPQSIVHSMVEFVDGSIIAQLAKPDMRLPIQYALLYPERVELKTARLDLTQRHNLEFLPPDRSRFKAIDLAFRALSEGGISPAVMNAANTIAAEAFRRGRIKLTDVYKVIEMTMDDIGTGDIPAIDDVLRANMWASDTAEDFICSLE